MAKLRKLGDHGYSFWCLGCGEAHSVWLTHPSRYNWQFKGDENLPSFYPSVLITCGHYMPDYKNDGHCWCTYNAAKIAKGEKPSPFVCFRCHSWVGVNGAQPGQIHYLEDSTHKYAGQTIDLPEHPELRTVDRT